tara:strand:- start:539 stop:1276 length:738 start_codon:yes stop_codon:yes gene_type:complete
MALNLDEFKANVLNTRGGLARTNKFFVEIFDFNQNLFDISIPTVEDVRDSNQSISPNNFNSILFGTNRDVDEKNRRRDDSVNISRDLKFYCSSTNLPGKNINTIDNRRLGYGDIQKMPISRTYDNFTASFFCDNQYGVMKFFHNWLNLIVDNSVEVGDFNPVAGSILDNIRRPEKAHREITYKEDYQTRIRLTTFNERGEQTHRYTLHEAFPVQIGSVDVGWEENDTLLQLPIEFTYRYFDTETL